MAIVIPNFLATDVFDEIRQAKADTVNQLGAFSELMSRNTTERLKADALRLATARQIAQDQRQIFNDEFAIEKEKHDIQTQDRTFQQNNAKIQHDWRRQEVLDEQNVKIAGQQILFSQAQINNLEEDNKRQENVAILSALNNAEKNVSDIYEQGVDLATQSDRPGETFQSYLSSRLPRVKSDLETAMGVLKADPETISRVGANFDGLVQGYGTLDHVMQKKAATGSVKRQIGELEEAYKIASDSQVAASIHRRREQLAAGLLDFEALPARVAAPQAGRIAVQDTIITHFGGSDDPHNKTEKTRQADGKYSNSELAIGRFASDDLQKRSVAHFEKYGRILDEKDNLHTGDIGLSPGLIETIEARLGRPLSPQETLQVTLSDGKIHRGRYMDVTAGSSVIKKHRVDIFRGEDIGLKHGNVIDIIPLGRSDSPIQAGGEQNSNLLPSGEGGVSGALFPGGRQTGLTPLDLYKGAYGAPNVDPYEKQRIFSTLPDKEKKAINTSALKQFQPAAFLEGGVTEKRELVSRMRSTFAPDNLIENTYGRLGSIRAFYDAIPESVRGGVA
ncbi:MAG: hypothetical protein ACRCWR_01815, partial [Saezia sp.]